MYLKKRSDFARKLLKNGKLGNNRGRVNVNQGGGSSSLVTRWEGLFFGPPEGGRPLYPSRGGNPPLSTRMVTPGFSPLKTLPKVLTVKEGIGDRLWG